MDREKIKRIQHFKVIASEIVMVIAVILTVSILVLIVSGYWLNADFKVERQGLLQISSVPTGADVDIDGDSSWLQRTNTSKTLSSGAHSIVLSKEGYDTWSKTIQVREGLLYRLHYPRLFLNNREVEAVSDVSNVIFTTVSPDHSIMLLANPTTNWQVLSLSEEKIKSHTINVDGLFAYSASTEDSSNASFTGEILSANWANDNAHVLFKIKNMDKTEWIILDIDNIKDSINLTQKFDMTFDDIQIMNNSASTLLALQGQSLRRIDVNSEQISAILADKIISLDHYENEVIFVAQTQNETSKERYVLSHLEMGNGKINVLDYFEYPAQAVISRFYDDRYITIVHDNIISLYEEIDFTKINDFSISFSPAHIKVGHNGEFILLYSDSNMATLDMEALAMVEWQAKSPEFGWLDDDMIYTIANGELEVYDFDGLNQRTIVKEANASFPATITDDKWLYYFSNNTLMREWLIKR